MTSNHIVPFDGERNIRQQVLNHMADVAKADIDQGGSGFGAIERAFPGTPIEVVTEAWLMADNQSVDEWWQMVEKTIDAEAVAVAVKKVAGPRTSG